MEENKWSEFSSIQLKPLSSSSTLKMTQTSKNIPIQYFLYAKLLNLILYSMKHQSKNKSNILIGLTNSTSRSLKTKWMNYSIRNLLASFFVGQRGNLFDFKFNFRSGKQYSLKGSENQEKGVVSLAC